MTLRLVISIPAGAGIGAAAGHFGKCASGTCPLTANAIPGAVWGGLIGLLLAQASTAPKGCAPPAQGTARRLPNGMAKPESAAPATTEGTAEEATDPPGTSCAVQIPQQRHTGLAPPNVRELGSSRV